MVLSPVTNTIPVWLPPLHTLPLPIFLTPVQQLLHPPRLERLLGSWSHGQGSQKMLPGCAGIGTPKQGDQEESRGWFPVPMSSVQKDMVVQARASGQLRQEPKVPQHRATKIKFGRKQGGLWDQSSPWLGAQVFM